MFIQTLGEKIMGELTALETTLGYVLLEKVDNSIPKKDITISNPYFMSCNDSNLDQCLEKLWQLENIPCKVHLTSDEIKCEKYLQKTVSNDFTGRFILPLSFKDSNLNLGESFSMAFHSFTRLERGLQKNLSWYKEFMEDYIDTGHMSLIPREHFYSKKWLVFTASLSYKD